MAIRLSLFKKELLSIQDREYPKMVGNQQQLSIAIQAALDGDWEKSHQIAQVLTDSSANWLHAVLHKIEGDKLNSQYWYAKTNYKKFEDFSDANAELNAIKKSLIDEA